MKILESCKILGVTFDSKLTFKSHANVMKGRALHHFQTMDKLVGQKWGLSPQTLIRLFNQVSIPKVLYAAPIWALRNLSTLNSASNKTIKQALGVHTSSNNSMTEIITRTPPIALRCETITARFCKKSHEIERRFKEMHTRNTRQKNQTRQCNIEGIRKDHA